MQIRTTEYPLEYNRPAHISRTVSWRGSSDAVSRGEHDVVVVIPEEFAAQLSDSVPAKVELITDQANTQGDREARRVRGALHGYSQQLASIRLTARGVSPLVLRPLNVDEVDVSTPSGRSAE